MIVLGLTGSVAMGKSTAARTLQAFGLPVFDADAAVHCLLGPGGAGVGPVGEAFPDCVGARTIDRARLGGRVFGDPLALARLETILHPLVRAEQARFLARCRARGEPAFLQAQRALRRPGMTPARLAAIRARQLADWEKVRRADFVIPTGLERRLAARAIAAMIDRLRARRPRVPEPACARS
jgi:dephospho-CoA kinase